MDEREKNIIPENIQPTGSVPSPAVEPIQPAIVPIEQPQVAPMEQASPAPVIEQTPLSVAIEPQVEAQQVVPVEQPVVFTAEPIAQPFEVPVMENQVAAPTIDSVAIAPEAPIVQQVEIPQVEVSVQPEVQEMNFDLNFEDQVNQVPTRIYEPEPQIAPVEPVTPVESIPTVEAEMPASAVQILMPDDEINPEAPQINLGEAQFVNEQSGVVAEEQHSSRLKPVEEAPVNKHGTAFIVILVILIGVFIIFLPTIFALLGSIFG